MNAAANVERERNSGRSRRGRRDKGTHRSCGITQRAGKRAGRCAIRRKMELGLQCETLTGARVHTVVLREEMKMSESPAEGGRRISETVAALHVASSVLFLVVVCGGLLLCCAVTHSRTEQPKRGSRVVFANFV